MRNIPILGIYIEIDILMLDSSGFPILRNVERLTFLRIGKPDESVYK